MDDVNCRGTENALLGCIYSKYENCVVTEGAGAVCSDPFSKCRFRSFTTV